MTPPRPADRPSRRLSLPTVAILAVTALGPAVPATPGQPAPALIGPTPLVYQTRPGPLFTAAEQLNALAVAAAGAPTTGPAGSGEHLRIVSWALHSRISHGRTVSTGAYAGLESWRRPDDSGRIRTHQPAGLTLSAPPAGSGQVDIYPPGRFPARWPARYGRPPANAAALARWLATPSTPHPGDDLAGWYLDAVVDLLRERVLAPGERAGVLRLLAQQPGLGYAGHATDRAGRRGHAFTLTSSRILGSPFAPVDRACLARIRQASG